MSGLNKRKVIAAVMAVMMVSGTGCVESDKEQKAAVSDQQTAVKDQDSAVQEQEAAVVTYTEEELGLRKVTLYTEETVVPDRGVYSAEDPGTSQTVERAFDNSPPVIPHVISDFLPVTRENNMCIGCHMPDVAEDMGAVPIPKSHLVNLRTGEDLKGELSGSRFNCLLCHAPQAEIPPLVKNSFQGGFRDETGRSRSNLIETLNEGASIE